MQTVVHKGKRLQNYIIDLTAIVALYFILYYVLPGTVASNWFLFYGLYFIYYFALEYSSGQTVGKMITKTVVKSRKGKKMTFGELLRRTTCRFFLLDGFSFLLGNHVGMHDWFSNSRVIDVRSSQNE